MTHTLYIQNFTEMNSKRYVYTHAYGTAIYNSWKQLQCQLSNVQCTLILYSGL